MFPARNAGRRSPLTELRDGGSGKRAGDERSRRRLGYVGAGVLVVFGLIYMAILNGWLADDLLFVILPGGMALALAGSVLTVPALQDPLSRFVERLLRPVLGFEARLAVRQLRRHAARTTLVVGVLMISLILSIGFGNAMISAVRDTRAWMVRIFDNVDFLIVPTALSGTELLPVAMPERYVDQLSRIDGVVRVAKGSILTSRAAGHSVVIFTRSCRPGEDVGFRLVGAPDSKIREGLRRGGVVIGTTLAKRTGLERGDQIPIETREGTHNFTIVGFASDYTAGGMIALMEWEQAKKFFAIEGARYIYVQADPQKRAMVEERLQRFCEDHHLILHSKTGFLRTCDAMMAGVLSSAWALMALVFVVASLGVTNFLVMNVLEQTRELGILRAVAMKRRQVGKMVVSEAIAMGLISAIPGVVLGILLGYAVIYANDPITGIDIPKVLSIPLVLGCVAVALIVSVLAALFPARQASRLNIIRALQYE